MNVVLAVAVVGTGSLLLRALPLLLSRRLPDRLSLLASWVGASMLAGFTVRALARFHDPAVPASAALAAVAAALSFGLAYAGRPVVVSVGAGIAAYLVLASAAALLV